MATTTSPSSALSSPGSFYTANGSGPGKSTTASSPAQSQPCPYRDVRLLPPELRQHCQILLEEQLYTSAIGLLNSILGAGISRRMPTGKAVLVPPPAQLALLSTLVVHPLHTTRAEEADQLEVSSQALGYLRSLLAIAGPLGADLRAAFQFRVSPRWGRRSGYSTTNNSDGSDGETDRDDDRLKGRLANESSLWDRGQDFWSVIGWAFNCSALHPRRWRYWRVWLEYMLDVLDSDWTERERRDVEAHETAGGVGNAPTTWRRDSIISMYMDQQNGRQGGFRAILKALFADGGEISMSSFREVFDREPKGPQKRSNKRKREMELDLENDKFGDYFDDESFSSGASEPSTPQKPRGAPKDEAICSMNAGLVESVNLRLRLFKFLSAATFALRKRAELNQLYEEYAAAVKVLPLHTFSLFVTQRLNPLLPETHTTILMELFHLLLPSTYKDPGRVDPDGAEMGSLTTPMLEKCYILHPANTVAAEDNAKLSLVVESALLLLASCDMLECSASLSRAAEAGILSRTAKAKKRRTGKAKTDAGEALAQSMLENSSMRIRVLLETLEACERAEC